MHKLGLALAFALVAAGCGSSGESSEETTTSPAVATTVAADAETTIAPDTTATPTTTAPTTTAAAMLEPLELIGDGPYDVGIETITIDAETERPLTVDVWFPLADGATGDPAVYTFVTGDAFESANALAVTREAIAADGPHPLVIYSHGSGGLRYIHSDYTEFLASHGYVVAAPDHTGNTAVEQFLETEDDGQKIASDRPNDVIAVIDAMTDASLEATTGLADHVDADRIAVTGHSFGGFTTYAVVSGFENEIGSSLGDERVDAIIPIAPAVGSGEEDSLLTDERLAAVDVPALVIVGTDDKTTPVDPNVERAWAETSSSPHYRLELVAAEHQSFTDVCDYLTAAEAGQEISAPVLAVIEDNAQAGCAEGDMPIDRVQELTNTFALTFLESVFADGTMIDPESTEIPDDVLYDTK